MSSGLLGYYPSEKYISRNWAPETIGAGNLKHLAVAQAQAVKTGLLTQQLAEAMLPIALIEGNGSNYGIVNSTYGYPPNPQRDKSLAKMGLRVVDYPGKPAPAPAMMTDEQKKFVAPDISTFDVFKAKDYGYWVPSNMPLERDADIHAKLVPVVLAEKARLYGDNNAIERWNGKGKALEDNGYGDEQKADSKYHKRKIEEMIKMLKHPKNQEILNTYQGLLKGK